MSSSDLPYLEISESSAEALSIQPDTEFVVIQKNEALLSGDVMEDVPVFVMIPKSGPDAVKLGEYILRMLNERFEMSDGRWRTKGNDAIHIPFSRASGDCICNQCGKKYYDHPMDGLVCSAIDNKPFLHVLCNGERVKL